MVHLLFVSLIVSKYSYEFKKIIFKYNDVFDNCENLLTVRKRLRYHEDVLVICVNFCFVRISDRTGGET